MPYASDGSEARWRVSAQKAAQLKEQGAFDWSYKGEKTTLKYLKRGELDKIDKGDYKVIGYKDNGAMIISAADWEPKWIPGSQWKVPSHQAGSVGGSVLIKTILNSKRFDFPKSLYAVHDAIRFFVANKPDALILDFFAGSGTTMHAVNLLNAKDGGNRRCIMVTNNEVSAEEAKTLKAQGHRPGSDAWNERGIARYVTWPRTVCSIRGCNVNGEPLKGDYISDQELPMAAGFKANAAFFKLTFLDKDSVELGMQFANLLPVLWLKAGAHGPCPQADSVNPLPPMLVLPQNRFAVLVQERAYADFARTLEQYPQIDTLFIVTDSETGYRNMIAPYSHKQCYQLYRDYLDNFSINTGNTARA